MLSDAHATAAFEHVAALKAGETVLDLGAGGGFGCFLAAKQLGRTGRVIGVDLTADMVAKARANAVKLAATNVEIRLGENEHLPLHGCRSSSSRRSTASLTHERGAQSAAAPIRGSQST